jgi:hypothetical protein
VNAEQSLDAVEHEVVQALEAEAAHSVPDNFMQADQGYRVKAGMAFSRHNSVHPTQQSGGPEDPSGPGTPPSAVIDLATPVTPVTPPLVTTSPEGKLVSTFVV